MFIMSLGEFGDLWDTFDGTKHSVIGGGRAFYCLFLKDHIAAKIHWFIFMSLLVILLLNLLIAMMGDTYAKVKG